MKGFRDFQSAEQLIVKEEYYLEINYTKALFTVQVKLHENDSLLDGPDLWAHRESHYQQTHRESQLSRTHRESRLSQVSQVKFDSQSLS